MNTRGAVLNALLAEYRQKRAKNTDIEAQRLLEATQKCPEIGELADARQDLIFRGLRMALGGAAIANAPEKMALYNSRIRALLKQNGFPEDYLQPVYDCAECQDTGYVGDNVRQMCRCLKTAYNSRLFHAVGLNQQSPQTFDSFDEAVYSCAPICALNASQRDVALLHMRTGREYADHFPRTGVPDLLLLGPSGVGKTYLMHAIAHRVLERGFLVLCVSAYKVIELSRRAHFHNDMTQMQALFDAELLMIDDLGAEPMMENITIPYLYNLINERQQAGQHTVITTNLSKDELKQRYTERIASRVLDPRQCRVMAFVGEDVRKRSGT